MGRTIKHSIAAIGPGAASAGGKRIATEVGTDDGSSSRSAVGQRPLRCGRFGGACGHLCRWGSPKRKPWENFRPRQSRMQKCSILFPAFELTLNSSAPGPTSLVVHFKDDAAAQKAEAMRSRKLAKTASLQARPNSRAATIRSPKRWSATRTACCNYFNRNAAAATSRSFIWTGKTRQQQQFVTVAIIGGAADAVIAAHSRSSGPRRCGPGCPGPGVRPEGRRRPPGAPELPPRALDRQRSKPRRSSVRFDYCHRELKELGEKRWGYCVLKAGFVQRLICVVLAASMA